MFQLQGIIFSEFKVQRLASTNKTIFLSHYLNAKILFLFVFGVIAPLPPPQWASASSFTRFLDNDEPQSVGLLWTRDQLVAETST